MIRKNKIINQVSISLLTVLLSGSLNTLAVFANTTEDPSTVSHNSGQTQEQKNDHPSASQKVIPSDSSVSVPQVSQTPESEVKATITTQKDENTKVETTTQNKNALSSKLLKGANPAEGTPGLQYNADCTEVTGYTGTATDIIIPNGVTTIGNRALQRKGLTTVTIPDSVTSIGEYAFYKNRLTTVTIPNTVTSIEKYAFAENQLNTVTIPNSVTSIGFSAFADNQLTTVTIPDSVTSIGQQAFTFNQLTTVTIPDSVTSIGSSAFATNHLTSVTIPDSVTTVGDLIAINQTAATTKVRRTSYTPADLGISTHYLEDKPVTLISQTPGVTFDGTSLHLDPSFTGNRFDVDWTSWDNRHLGSLTINLVDSVKGTITYLDQTGNTLLPAKDVSSQVGGTFNWTIPENIDNYTPDLALSQVITISESGQQVSSINDMMSLTHTTTLEELIASLNQQTIGLGTKSVEIRYVYTKNPVLIGQVTVKYVDTDGHSIATDKILSGSIGDTYQTEQLAIDGFSFKSIDGKATGQYTADPQVVTYVYTKNGVTPTPTNSTTSQTSNDKQLPSTGDNQKTSLISSTIGAIALIVVLTVVGLRIKHNRSSK